MAGPVAGDGSLSLRRGVRACLQAQRDAVGNEDPVADRPVRAYVPEAPGAIAVEIHGRVAAQDVEALLRAEVEHDAPRSEPHREVRPCSAALRVRPLDQSIPLDPQPIGDPEADPAPASDLVVELEGAVEPREAREPAALEPEAVLGPEGCGPSQQQYG